MKKGKIIKTRVCACGAIVPTGIAGLAKCIACKKKKKSKLKIRR